MRAWATEQKEKERESKSKKKTPLKEENGNQIDSIKSILTVEHYYDGWVNVP